MRIMASDGPPAANGTTTVMGRVGNFSAAVQVPVSAINKAQADSNDLDISFSECRNVVIASEAKQSIAPQKIWIATSLRSSQ
jgi:hypothetical protein